LADVWESRSEDEWKQLGQKYHFRLVLSQTIVPLHLRPVLPGARWTLYEID
jgi:hypothetical protein